MKKIGYLLIPFVSLSFFSSCTSGPNYTVTFKTNSKSQDIVQTVREGYRVKKPDDPVNPGFEFAGWYYDNKTFEYQYNFDTKVCQDFKLYAKWASDPVIELNSNTLNYFSVDSTADYYCGIISIKDQYAADYDVPSINSYYKVKIGDKQFTDFQIENIYSVNHTAKILLPKSSITDKVTISAEAYEKCLTFTATSDNTNITYTNTGSVDTSGLYYQIKNAGTWADETSWSDGAAISLSSGQQARIYNKKTSLNSSTEKYIKFASNNPIAASGNIMSLLNNGSLQAASFHNLFNGMALTTLPVLPATNLANGCYANMFENCTNFKDAPLLPAVKFSNQCYQAMFKNSSVESAWINAKETKLADRAFKEMFFGCTSIKTVQVNFGGGVFWPDQTECTKAWLPSGPGYGRTFYWNGSTNISELSGKGLYGNVDHIPDGWNVANPY